MGMINVRFSSVGHGCRRPVHNLLDKRGRHAFTQNSSNQEACAITCLKGTGSNIIHPCTFSCPCQAFCIQINMLVFAHNVHSCYGAERP